MEEDFDKKLQRLLSSKRYEFVNLKRKELPKETGVYVIWDRESIARNLPLYVGRTKDLQRRLCKDHRGEKPRQGLSYFSAFRRSVAVKILKLVEQKKEAKTLPTDKEKAVSDHIQSRCEFQFITCDAEIAKTFEEFVIAKLKPTLNDC